MDLQRVHLPRSRCQLASESSGGFSASTIGVSACPFARKYLELQNEWPFLDIKLSFFRGKSPLSLHFQSKIQTIWAFVLQFQYWTIGT